LRRSAPAVLLLFLAGCSSGGTPKAGGTPTPVATSAVRAKDFEFGPADIAVKAGTTVRWSFVGAVPHTVTASPGQGVTFDSGQKTRGTFTFVFATPGTYHYYCKLHGSPTGQGMAGTVTVTS
jgi:plastocyanin